jgi:hypothetical protein
MSDPLLQEQWRGALTGELYPTKDARDHYERIAAQRLANDANDDPLNPNYTGPSADDIKRAHELVQNAQTDKAKDLADQRSAQVFIELNPWFKPCPENANIMQTVCEARGLTDDIITVEQLEEIAATLADRGLLKIDAAKLADEKKAEVRGQAEEIRTARRGKSSSGISSRTISRSVRPSYSEDQLDAMSLDQIRELAMKEAWE